MTTSDEACWIINGWREWTKITDLGRQSNLEEKEVYLDNKNKFSSVIKKLRGIYRSLILFYSWSWRWILKGGDVTFKFIYFITKIKFNVYLKKITMMKNILSYLSEYILKISRLNSNWLLIFLIIILTTVNFVQKTLYKLLPLIPYLNG